MSANLHLFQLQEARLQNSKRKRSAKSKENVLQESQREGKLSHAKIRRLTQENRRQILSNRDFNFELGQEFLESRHVAYQSKDLKYSLKNAKQVEKSLMQLGLEDSDRSSALTPDSFSKTTIPGPDRELPLPAFPGRSNAAPLQASRNKFSSSRNTFSEKNSLRDTKDISEFLGDSPFVHDTNDELALVDYSSGSKLRGKRGRQLASYRANPRMHMYRSINSDEVSQIRLENRDRMARRETRNPLMQFFHLILVKFGCSDH